MKTDQSKIKILSKAEIVDLKKKRDDKMKSNKIIIK